MRLRLRPNRLVIILCVLAALLTGARPLAAQSPASESPAAQAIIEAAAASLGWEPGSAAVLPAGAALERLETGSACGRPVAGTRLGDLGDSALLLRLVAGDVELPWDLPDATRQRVNLSGVVADYWVLPAAPGADAAQSGAGTAVLSWRMGGLQLTVSAETNCPDAVRADQAVVPLAHALFEAASRAGLAPAPDAVVPGSAAPTPADDSIRVEWAPRYLAAVGDTAEMLITLQTAAGEPAAGEHVVIERVQPPGASVEGVTGETGALIYAITHDAAGTLQYRYVVRALGTERTVEVPVIAAQLTLEGSTTTGNPYTGVAADGASSLAVLLEVPGWPGTVQLQAPTYGHLETAAGGALDPAEVQLDPLGRAQFIYVPPTYIDVVSHTLTLPPEAGRTATAHGVLDVIPLALTDGDGNTFTVPLGIPVYRPPVVLVHGLADGQAGMRTLAEQLSARGYDADLADYTATAGATEGTARSQARLLQQRIGSVLAGYAREGIKIARLDVVTLSTGGLAGRAYLQDDDLYGGNVRKLLMLAPPNHGAGLQDRPLAAIQQWWAQRLGARAIEFWSGAEGYRQLNAGEDRGEHLRSGVQYAVLAGRLPAQEFIDPHLDRDLGRGFTDSDGVVTVASAALERVPLYLIDGACHSAELGHLTPPRPEPGIADMPETWDRVTGLLNTPIAPDAPRSLRAVVLRCEGCAGQVSAGGAGGQIADGTLLPWSPLHAAGGGLVGLYSGEELQGLLSLAPGSEVMLDTLAPSGLRVLLRTGALRCRAVGRQPEPLTFSVVIGDPPPAGGTFAPLARAWDLGADFVVQAGADEVLVASLGGQVVAETQNVDGVALGRLLNGGEAAVVRTGEAPARGNAPTERWWTDALYDPPAPPSAALARRLGAVALALLGAALLAGLIGLADHGRLEPALADLSREGFALRQELADGAARRPDLHALATQDSHGRWWSYDPLTDSWSAAEGDEWRSASPPRYSSRRLWQTVATLFLIVGLALGALALFMR